jgi:hypothetical protein
MIDISTETLMSLAAAAHSLPARRAGKPAHVSGIFRWTAVGLKGIVLESIQIGGTRCTSREALQRFFDALSTLALGGEPAPAPPSSKESDRRRAVEAAEQRLARSGL